MASPIVRIYYPIGLLSSDLSSRRLTVMGCAADAGNPAGDLLARSTSSLPWPASLSSIGDFSNAAARNGCP
jgi:hypothetical protein